MSKFFRLSAPVLIGLALLGCTSQRPLNLGVKDGQLSPCPDKPNCVSSQSSDESHAIDPFPYSGDASLALNRLSEIIQNMEGTKIVHFDDTYLYAEFQSSLMKFVDDVEFLADTAGSVIHVRSASRLGYSDLGVNRKRIQTIREKFINTQP